MRVLARRFGFAFNGALLVLLVVATAITGPTVTGIVLGGSIGFGFGISIALLWEDTE